MHVDKPVFRWVHIASTSCPRGRVPEDAHWRKLVSILLASAHPGQMRTPSGEIEQILLNLVTNARDAIADTGKITIRTANVESDRTDEKEGEPVHYVMIAVSDTGAGIDEDTQAHIFEPFFTTKQNGVGTGLDLSTIYGIVRQSGGSIEVDSEPGQGMTFTIYLPRIDDSKEALI